MVMQRLVYCISFSCLWAHCTPVYAFQFPKIHPTPRNIFVCNEVTQYSKTVDNFRLYFCNSIFNFTSFGFSCTGPARNKLGKKSRALFLRKYAGFTRYSFIDVIVCKTILLFLYSSTSFFFLFFFPSVVIMSRT